ncbi:MULTISPECIES: AraC family transcriptional regulator [unclassified Nocardioides]|uniref:helix-turn-helix domain-containing protein n=1 Tax=unclassified Nocardioides TaxID=2615069 RepID=UPI002406AA74|nr:MULTISPECIES: AraC family transcriptional regulator [unclassified Nocardioides]MDF9715519.1 AraC family transcriptional regulator [Nocardioides sp. ChNu-99]
MDGGAGGVGSGGEHVTPIDRAHLTGVSRPTPPIHRYLPSPDLVDLVDRYWIPVWSLREPSTQSTLQHPVCLLVVSGTYARCYGVSRGLSTVVLEGDGYAVGVMLRPAAGRLVLGRPVGELVDGWCDLAQLATLDGAALTAEVRAAVEPDPTAEGGHRAAIAAYERRLRTLLPVDPQGLLINDVVAWLQAHPEVTRVSEVAAAHGLGERALHRLVEQRVGLSPKWLVQRRRLHDAVVALKAGTTSLAAVAADLGYTDQAHFTRDFRSVTGTTPGRYLADQPGAR